MAPSQQRSDPGSAIAGIVQRQRRALRRRDLLVGLQYAVALSLVTLTAASLWAVSHAPVSPSPTLAALSLALIWGLFLVRYVAIPWLHWSDDSRVARAIGERAPGVRSDLVSSIELGEATQRAHHYSPALLAALTTSTAQRLEELSPAVLRPSRDRRPTVLLGVALVVTIVGMSTGWLPAGLLQMLQSDSSNRVALSATPLVADLEASLDFPQHTGKPPLTVASTSGDLQAVPGTRIELRGQTVEPASLLTLVTEDGDTIGATLEKNDRFRVALVVNETTSYRFRLEPRSGAERIEERWRRIQVEPDRPPAIELHAPADELDVADLRRIELAYVAEDDYGLSKIELRWIQDGVEAGMELTPSEAGAKRAQDKFYWDLTEVSLTPGTRIDYRVDAWDNDTVDGPKRSSSRTFSLRVYSVRERHDELIREQEKLLERLIATLGAALVIASDDISAHRKLVSQLDAAATHIGSIISKIPADPLAHDRLGDALLGIREHLDLHSKKVTELIEKRGTSARFQATDKRVTEDLEDDILVVVDWVDRQRIEALLAVGDEIEAHEKRLAELLEELERTGSDEAKQALLREIRRLRRKISELSARHQTMPNDILDQYVNRDAVALNESRDCLEEVAELVNNGDLPGARAALERCMEEQREHRQALDQSLSALRGERFTEEQRELEEARSELADLVQDQRNLSAETERLWQKYAEQLDENMRERLGEMRNRVGRLVSKLEKQVEGVPRRPLSRFSREERDVVIERVGDIEEMLKRGDVAEALALAKEAETGLEAMDAETHDGIDHGRPWTEPMENALKRIGRAKKTAGQLIRELEKATPSPAQLLSEGERQKMKKLGRQQRAIRERAKELLEKIGQPERAMPGQSRATLNEAVDGALPRMERAEQGFRRRRPSDARIHSREALRSLQEGEEALKQAARNAATKGSRIHDEPVRIPGAEEYRAPESFREQILDAMKTHEAPEGYGERIRKYYEELIR